MQSRGQATALAALLFAVTACQKNTTDSQAAVPTVTASDTGLIGRWCYKPAPVPATWAVMEIRNKAGSFSLTQLNHDGSQIATDLTKTGKGLFADTQSVTGDRFRITPTGDLDVLDNDGLIATATKLDASATPSECS